MKKTKETPPPIHPEMAGISVKTDVSGLSMRISSLEKERRILMELGEDITKVRDKNDLIVLMSDNIKRQFPFSHSIITLIDEGARTYTPFLLDPKASPIQDHPIYSRLVAGKYPLSAPLFQEVLAHDGPSTFIMEDIMDVPGNPNFLRVNYERGIREIMITPLKSKEKPMGFMHIYTKDTVSMTDEFISIITGIAPQISSAVINILKNEEIAHEERINEILISLGHEMAKVRDRQDLMKVISSGLRDLIGFSHSMMTVMDETEDHYKAYLVDADSHLRELTDSGDVFSLSSPAEDGIYDIASLYYKPVIFDMAALDEDKMPLWCKLHYEAGAREMIVKILGGNGPTRYSLMLFADKQGSFGPETLNIIQRISSLLFTAASNISANEEIIKREYEKSFLLDFSNDIAGVRSQNDLSDAVHKCLGKINHLQGFSIAKLSDDHATLNICINSDAALHGESFALDELNERVLDSEIPLFFSVNKELSRGNNSAYLQRWKENGFKTMVGMTLRTGDAKLGILWLGIEDINMPLLQGISAQISVAMYNIMANEEILRREKEQSFLLEFSHDIAAVRTKDDLHTAVFKVLQKVLHTRLSMMRVIEDDGLTLGAYMYDESMNEKDPVMFKALLERKLDIHHELSARVMNSKDPVLFNIAEEEKNGSDAAYLRYWQSFGLKSVFGAPLRVGETNLGTMWLLTDEINMTILKGITAQISIAISNIRANEKILSYKQRLEIENDYLKEQIKTIYNFSEIVGSGAQMQKVYRLMSQVAETGSTVLLLGETGTGKELIARALHNASPRKGKLMVKINCAALPAHLIESELFGHEKGAFTGATDRRIGKFEMAHNSTLFLDEIGEMPLELQVKLLRVLQEREFERIGGRNTIKVDVRIIAATNRNLEEEVQAGRFRSDLYYRLNVFPINLPPLRERQEDIEPLANFFISKFGKNIGKKVNGLSAKVMQELRSYDWPGNVRELEHLVERSILLCDGPVLKEVLLPRHQVVENTPVSIFTRGTLEQIERAHIIAILKRCGGKISGAGGAAEILDVPGTTLHSKMKKLDISKADYYAE